MIHLINDVHMEPGSYELTQSVSCIYTCLDLKLFSIYGNCIERIQYTCMTTTKQANILKT